MEQNTYISRTELAEFFAVNKRSLPRVLRDAGIKLRSNGTQWSVVLEVLGYAPEQTIEHWPQLTAPLLTAPQVARLLKKPDPSIIYRWANPDSPNYRPDFPAEIDISFGRRSNARNVKRWRKAEVLAWHRCKPTPIYRLLDWVEIAPDTLHQPPEKLPNDNLQGIFTLSNFQEEKPE